MLAPIIDNDPTGLTCYIPGSGRFRIYTVVSHRPMRTTEEYRLTVDGMVDDPARAHLPTSSAPSCRRPGSPATSSA